MLQIQRFLEITAFKRIKNIFTFIMLVYVYMSNDVENDNEK